MCRVCIMIKNFKNILVVRTDKLGDVILTTPALQCLREAYPKARITLLVAPALREIVESNPFIDEILVDDRTGEHKWLFGFIKLVLFLRKKKFDLAINYHTKKRTNVLCFLAGIPHRTGYKNNKFGFLLTHPIVDKRHWGEKHESEYCLDVLRYLDVSVARKEFFVTISKEAEDWLDAFLKKNNIASSDRVIVIHPGASDPARRWPGYYFAELIRLIHTVYPSCFIIIGNKDIHSIAENFIQSGSTPIIDLTGKTNLSQLASLIKRSDLLISNDSGPVHLATGLSRPVVAIFTRNQKGINPKRWGPLGPKARVVSVPEDNSISFVTAKAVNADYLELIKPQEVFEAVDAVLKTC